MRLANARRIAAILHTPPGALYPVHLASIAIRLPLSAGCDTSAAIDAPATTMLAVCAIVTMPEGSC